jgi:hypothetical protein
MKTPSFTDLTRDECLAIIAKHHVARLAYTFHDKVDIEPIGYVQSGGGLVFRTAPGSKIETLAHHPWVALEVDDAKGMFEWESVVVHGTMYVLHPTGNDAEVRAYNDAVNALRNVAPETFREDDPVPFRSIVMRLELDQITGRRATQNG